MCFLSLSNLHSSNGSYDRHPPVEMLQAGAECAGRRNASRHFCETRYSKYARRLRNRAHAALRRSMASRARQMTRLLSKTGDACSKSAAGMRDDVRGRCEPRDGTSTLGLDHIKRAIASMLRRHWLPPARRRGGTNGWPLLCSWQHLYRAETCCPS